MAKQDGFHPVIGSLGKTTFYKTPDGYYAKAKGRVSAEKMATDPAFERFRDNKKEFGRAVKANTLLRKNLKTILFNSTDRRLLRRLTEVMLKVVKSDPVNPRGERTVQKGVLAELKGFDFNASSRLSVVFTAPFNVSIDRAAGILSMDIPSFIPGVHVKAPVGTTHFNLTVAAGAFNFETGEATVDIQNGAVLPMGNTPTPAVSPSCVIPGSGNLPLFLFCGITYYEEVNGTKHPITAGAFNALQIVEVNTI